MQALDTTIANVALPHMQGGLSATQDQTAWVLTSYIAAAAIMIAVTLLVMPLLLLLRTPRSGPAEAPAAAIAE